MGNQVSSAEYERIKRENEGVKKTLERLQQEKKIESDKKRQLELEEQERKAKESNKRLEEEIQKRRQYDVVFNIEGIEKLLEKGWKVDIGENAVKTWNGHVVGVMGQYNRGKSFILNQLCGLQFQSGYTVTTLGLSVKFMTSELKHVVLDSAGLYSPILMDNIECKDEKSEDSDLFFEEKKKVEDFLNSLILALSDYLIIVVEDISWPDQQFIFNITKKRYNSNRPYKEVFIIHNMKNIVDKKDFDILWKQRRSLYVGDEKVQKVTVGMKEQSVPFFFSQTANARHVALGNHNGVFIEHNMGVFALLRKWIDSIVMKNDSNHTSFDPVVGALKGILPDFLDGTLEEIQFDEGDQCLKLYGKQLAPKKGGSNVVLALTNFDPKYTIEEDEKNYHIILEIPCLKPEELTITVSPESDVPRHFLLTVSGKIPEPMISGRKLKTNTRQYGAFTKKFDVPLIWEMKKPVKLSPQPGVIELSFPKNEF